MKCPYLITPLQRRPLVIDNISLKNCYLPVLRTVNITAGQCFIQTPKHWEGGIKTVEGSTRSSSRRRRNRDADGVERVGNGEGYPPPQPTRGSGERCELPPVGSGAEPRPKTNLVHSRAVRNPLVAIIYCVFKCTFYITYRLNN